MKNMLKKIALFLTKKDKKTLILLFLFSILISMIETIGISAIVPFISIATDFNSIHKNQYLEFIYNLLNFNNDISFVTFFGFILVLFYLFRGISNYYYYYYVSWYTHRKSISIAYILFSNYFNQSYKEFTKRNSSNLTKILVHETSHLTSLISAFLMILSEIFIVVFIYLIMLYIDYTVTILLTLLLVVKSLFMVKTVSSQIKTAGISREKILNEFYELINRSFANFKLIKLNTQEDVLFANFQLKGEKYADSNITNAKLSNFPRLFLETFSFVLITLVIIYLVNQYRGDISSSIGFISMFVLAFYRIMPSLSRILNSYNQIMFFHKSLDVVYDDLNISNEKLGNSQINFNKNIVLKNISFSYEDGKNIIEDINIAIEKGSKIAFIGESGSGKSTLIDIIIGLHKPNKGTITIDSTILDESNIKSWRKKIGYIPQSVYLFDGTVAENIAFGNDIDIDKMNSILKKVKIFDFLNTKNGLDTKVGEGGVMLSGGQKQRIAIARALYTEPELLVLDEATSALDIETEEKIMDEIYDLCLDKTLIIIAHRLNTIQRCEVKYRVDKGVCHFD